MKVYILSRTNYDEPKRVRQQLADLLSEDYEVIYCQPNSLPRSDVNLKFLSFRLIERYSSLPIVGLLNFIFLKMFIRKNVEPGSVLINFMPELGIAKIYGYRFVTFINDDFSAMAPLLTRRWMERLITRAVKNSEYSLFSSYRLMDKYSDGGKSSVFYPWADSRTQPTTNNNGVRNRLVFWGYIGNHIDFLKTEEILSCIESLRCNIEVDFYGPVNEETINIMDKLSVNYKCFNYYSAIPFSDLEPETILCALEILKPEKEFGSFIEVPNKAPKFLACGIPLAYSGVDLLDVPCFIPIESVERFISSLIDESSYKYKKSCEEFLSNNGYENRKSLLQGIISKVCSV